MTGRGKLSFIILGLIAAMLAVVFATQAQPAAVTSPLALRQGELRQVGKSLQFTVHTAGPIVISALEPRPNLEQGSARYLCLDLEQRDVGEAEEPYGELICVGESANSVGVTSTGGPVPETAGDGVLEATVERPKSDVLTVSIPLGELRLPFGEYGFRFVSSDGSCGSDPDSGCVDQLPEDGAEGFQLRVPAMASCSGVDGEQLRYGPRNSKRVALTFDDGPGPSTAEILDILADKRADGTFFLLGDAVELNPELTRQIVEQGSEVANHSMQHDALPTEEDLVETNDVIEAAAGFRPCSFRPPYGQVDPPLTKRAAKQKMNTVLWDVDTEDWTDWTTVDSVVEGTKSNSQAGSIILMHDGGDQRREKTIEALPRIIDELRAEGYSFVTVSELLGNKVEWQPAGSPHPD